MAEETSDVASQTSGQVVATPVGIGAFVRQGSVVARLNDKDARIRLQQSQADLKQAIASLRREETRLGLGPGGKFDSSTIPEVRAAAATLEQAQAELRLAEANERRYRDLVETGDVAVTAYDQFRTTRDTARARVNNERQVLESAINVARQINQGIRVAEAAVESSRSQVATAEKAVADTNVRAPFSGYVSDRPIALGEYVTPSSIIVRLLRTNPIKLQMQVQESEVPHLRPGMGVALEVDAYKDRKFGGQITAVNPAVDPVSRAAMVEASIENGDNALRSGMFATAKIARSGGNKAVFVPRSAVFSDQNTQSYRVFVIQGGIAKLRVVQIGTNENDATEILSGVEADEVVATSNLEQLFEGAEVKQ
jgi:RND family efflux transporter MFP subunit